MTDPKPKTLQEALVIALSEMPNPVKNADNPAFKRDGKVLRYADLEATLDAAKPILAANGIAVMQMPVSDDQGVGVHTVLVGHGEQMDCGTFTLPLSKRDPQGAGGAITYARRYALTSLFGLAQEDDDANHASQPSPSTSQHSPSSKPASGTGSENSTPAILKLMEAAIAAGADKKALNDWIAEHYGTSLVKDIPAERKATLAAALRKRIADARPAPEGDAVADALGAVPVGEAAEAAAVAEELADPNAPEIGF